MASAPIVDVVPLPGSATEALVSAEDGTLAMIELADGTVRARELRGAQEGLAPSGIVALSRERVVLWGWEQVEALDVATGATLWRIDDGDHSLDEVHGRWLAPLGADHAMLPNGVVVDVRTGKDATTADAETEPCACASDARQGLVAAMYDGRVLGCDGVDAHRRLATRELATFAPHRARALALVGPGSGVIALVDDGAVVVVGDAGARTLWTEALAPDEIVLGAAVAVEASAGATIDAGTAAAIEIAVAIEIENTRTRAARFSVRVAGRVHAAALDARANHFVAAHALDGCVAVVLCGRLTLHTREGSSPVELASPISAAAACGTSFIVGDESGAVTVLARSATA